MRDSYSPHEIFHVAAGHSHRAGCVSRNDQPSKRSTPVSDYLYPGGFGQVKLRDTRNRLRKYRGRKYIYIWARVRPNWRLIGRGIEVFEGFLIFLGEEEGRIRRELESKLAKRGKGEGGGSLRKRFACVDVYVYNWHDTL